MIYNNISSIQLEKNRNRRINRIIKFISSVVFSFILRNIVNKETDTSTEVTTGRRTES